MKNKKFKKIKWVLTYNRGNNTLTTQHYNDKDLMYWINNLIKDNIYNYKIDYVETY